MTDDFSVRYALNDIQGFYSYITTFTPQLSAISGGSPALLACTVPTTIEKWIKCLHKLAIIIINIFSH